MHVFLMILQKYSVLNLLLLLSLGLLGTKWYDLSCKKYSFLKGIRRVQNIEKQKK
jgi:hypothetical protein